MFISPQTFDAGSGSISIDVASLRRTAGEEAVAEDVWRRLFSEGLNEADWREPRRPESNHGAAFYSRL